MGLVKAPLPVKLVVAMLSGSRALFREASMALEERYGQADLTSDCLPFTHTQYYAAELGPALERCFISFRALVDSAELASVKLHTNALEQCWTSEGRRRVNLDPGYLTPGKLVLATTKDHGHRIYLGQGIYAEVTLAYRDHDFRPWPWTYPDYRTEEYLTIFRRIRLDYMGQLRSLGLLQAKLPGA